jgi:hypothetical protein
MKTAVSRALAILSDERKGSTQAAARGAATPEIDVDSVAEEARVTG